MNGLMTYPLTLMFAVFLALVPACAQAHEGEHGPDMLAVVNSVTVQGHTVTLSLTVTNLGGPLVLTGLEAAGAQPVTLDPVYINFAQDVVVQIDLDFSTTPPAIFTLDLSFGPLGQSTISVVLN